MQLVRFTTLSITVGLFLAAQQSGSSMVPRHMRSHNGNSVAAMIMTNGSFKTLTRALQTAGLGGTLQGGGPFTVFAPTDAAFAKLPKKNLDDLMADKAKLRKVLLYHVVGKRLMSADIAKLGSVKTLEGESLMTNAKGDSVMVDGSLISKADMKGKNGVVHQIDEVLMPGRGK